MDVVALRVALDAVRARLDAGEEVPVDDVEGLLSHVEPCVAGAARQDITALKASVDALQQTVRESQTVLGESLERLGRGRRGNEGYRSLRANRKTQRLYRRA